VSSAIAAVLALGQRARAQDDLHIEHDARAERIEVARSRCLPVVFEGFVLEPDGTPAEGALVVSSAGGEAVTDARGSFRLAVQVSIEAECIQVTSIGRPGGSVLAGKTVSLSGGAGAVWVGSLQLALGSACSPSWLPTFGEAPGTSQAVWALTVYDDGGGPALYVGGDFTTAGGVVASRVAKWNGTRWAALGSGVNDAVRALTVFDDGSGPSLYAGGSFTVAGGTAASHIAKWDGASWAALGSGTSSEVSALTVHDDGGGPALYAGGSFLSALDSGDSFLAKWGCDTTPPTLTCPSSLAVVDRVANGPGEIVTFSVTASDDQDPAPTILCSPPSGSLFPHGTTFVTCTATDASGNVATCEFPVAVLDKKQPRER
jgi:hypothetical protein